MDFDFGTTRRKVKGIVNGFDLCMLKRSFLEQNESSFFGTSRQCGMLFFGWILAESFVFTSAAIYAILEHTDSTCL